MDKEKFDKYLNERYLKQIDWYDRKSIWNKKWNGRFVWGLIIISSLTPVMIAIDWGLFEFSFLRWLSIIFAVVTAILAAALRAFRFQEHWMNYRTICESLRKELYYYEANIYDYSTAKDKESLFVERTEKLISQSNTIWIGDVHQPNLDIVP